MTTLQIVKARAALGAIISGPNVPEDLFLILQQAHDGLLAEERKDPKEQHEAMIALGNDTWEIA